MNAVSVVSKDEFVSGLVNNASWFQKIRAIVYPVRLGTFQPVDLIASDTFYLFTCEHCGKYSVDHLHGKGSLYCHLCN